jgi:hypothetical protein
MKLILTSSTVVISAFVLATCSGGGIFKGPEPQPLGKVNGQQSHSFTCHYGWGFGYDECVAKLKKDSCGPAVKVVNHRDRKETARVLAGNKWVWQTTNHGDLVLTGCNFKKS